VSQGTAASDGVSARAPSNRPGCCRRARFGDDVIHCRRDVDRRHRPAGLLRLLARPDRAADDPPPPARDVARRPRHARARPRLRDTLSAAVRGRGGARGGADAGGAGRAALAARGPQRHGTGRGIRPGAARHVVRPGAARPRARARRAARLVPARDLAGDGGRRAPDRRGAQPARRVGAHRPHAVRPRPSLHRRAAVAPAAGQRRSRSRPRCSCRRSPRACC
jgi:hypothetical protein